MSFYFGPLFCPYLEPIYFLFQDKRLSAADSAVLTRQRETLLQKLEEFDRTNKALRRLLRDAHQKEVRSITLRLSQFSGVVVVVIVVVTLLQCDMECFKEWFHISKRRD